MNWWIFLIIVPNGFYHLITHLTQNVLQVYSLKQVDLPKPAGRCFEFINY
jgi:hypothetical protein